MFNEKNQEQSLIYTWVRKEDRPKTASWAGCEAPLDLFPFERTLSPSYILSVSCRC